MKPTKEEVEDALKEYVEASEKMKRFSAQSISANQDLPISNLKEMAKAFDAAKRAQEKHHRLSKEYFGF